MSTLADQLVTANHVLANEGVIRGFGHVSTREPGSDTFLISRSRSPGMVEPSDILEVSLSGDVVSDDSDVETYSETVIHRSIYEQRDDVGAVVHHHADEIMPFTCSETELRPVFRRAAQFHEGIPEFSDYDELRGQLIATDAEGRRMAKNLGDRRAQILMGHGANVVGTDVKRAVLSTLDMRMNAEYQSEAEQLGNPIYYDRSREATESYLKRIFSDSSVNRKWEYLVNKLDDRS
jgi:ribulose-5-phosphate 4-epimerase/fuculose-1-phosphate aldolase